MVDLLRLTWMDVSDVDSFVFNALFDSQCAVVICLQCFVRSIVRVTTVLKLMVIFDNNFVTFFEFVFSAIAVFASVIAVN